MFAATGKIKNNNNDDDDDNRLCHSFIFYLGYIIPTAIQVLTNEWITEHSDNELYTSHTHNAVSHGSTDRRAWLKCITDS